MATPAMERYAATIEKNNVSPNTKLEEDSKDMKQFAADLEKDSDSDDAVVIHEDEVNSVNVSTAPGNIHSTAADPVFDMNDGSNELSEAEKELLRDELKKTEDEITTLKQVLMARQKHASELKRKLGLNPIAELTSDINKGLKSVAETEAFQKTQEVAAATADTVKEKWNDMRNSSLFKSFESKLGSAYNNAKMAASTSIDHLAGAARGPSQAATPAEEAKPMV